MTFQGQLVYHLLSFMQHDDSKKNLIFKIGDKFVRFGPDEYYVITGLPFSGVAEIPSNSDLHKNIFGGRELICLDDIEKAFKSVKASTNGSGDLMLKLALLWFLYGALFCDAHKKIPSVYMHILDDLPSFNKYPWGLKSYEYLVQKMHRSHANMLDTLNTQKRATFDVFGFVFVLQVWLFETIPGLGDFCAKRVDKYDEVWPRVLRWSSIPGFKTHQSISKFLTMEHLIHVVSFLIRCNSVLYFVILLDLYDPSLISFCRERCAPMVMKI